MIGFDLTSLANWFATVQADYLLGYRVDRPTRCELPPAEK
jgi:hypothetical protein